MHRFFSDTVNNKEITLQNENAKHIIKSLRMKVLEKLIVCDKKGIDYFCTIKEIKDNTVTLTVTSIEKNKAEPNVDIHLYMAFSKNDKMEFIVQKATELGVCEITPIVTKFTVSRPSQKSTINKIIRYKKIAEEASKQSGRGKIPIINNPLTFEQCLSSIKNFDASIIMYEKNGKKIKDAINLENKNIAVIIGSEGGFCETEITKAKNNGVQAVNLGCRILRCETAPIVTLSILMEYYGNF